MHYENKLAELFEQREHFWKQRAKEAWLRDGNCITQFFHAKATAKKKRNKIEQLKDRGSNWKTWDIELNQVISDYLANCICHKPVH